jgi:alpha-amylase
VHSGSNMHTQDNARARGVYAAYIEGKNGGKLYVRIGGSDNEWNPSHSNYKDFREYAAGTGWKVWVGLPDNPELRLAPLAASLPVPTFQKPTDISIPDSMVHDLNP